MDFACQISPESPACVSQQLSATLPQRVLEEGALHPPDTAENILAAQIHMWYNPSLPSRVIPQNAI